MLGVGRVPVYVNELGQSMSLCFALMQSLPRSYVCVRRTGNVSMMLCAVHFVSMGKRHLGKHCRFTLLCILNEVQIRSLIRTSKTPFHPRLIWCRSAKGFWEIWYQRNPMWHVLPVILNKGWPQNILIGAVEFSSIPRRDAVAKLCSTRSLLFCGQMRMILSAVPGAFRGWNSISWGQYLFRRLLNYDMVFRHDSKEIVASDLNLLF